MEVVRAKSAGFCYGVKRAISMLERLVDDGVFPIYTLGPIIHNRFVVSDFEKRGVRVLKGCFEGIPAGRVVTRAHGVEKESMEKLKRLGFEVFDATCPFVKKAQVCAQLLEREGFFPVIFGDPSHAEVRGIRSYASECEVVSGLEDLDKVLKRLKAMGVKKVGVLSQTTQTLESFLKVACFFVENLEDVRVMNTICSATRERQKEARRLAGEVEVMIVVGDRGSRNTMKLYEICKSVNDNTFHIESSKELEPGWFTFCRRVGITAGASTPDYVIEDVENALKKMDGGGSRESQR